jgi:hypothetical protein
VSASTFKNEYVTDVLGRVTAPSSPHGHEREIYLSFERRSKWARLLSAPMLHLQQLATLTLMGAAGVGTASPLLHLLPAEMWWIAWIMGACTAVGIYWYIEVVRPDRREKKLHQQALQLAGSPARKLQFTNGATSDFIPKGAISTTAGNAMGFDPKHQLIRSVFVDGFNGHIWLDWVFGLDTLGELVVADMAGQTIRNVLRRFLRQPPRTNPTLAFRSPDGKMQKLGGIPTKHLATARRMVREMNFHRPSAPHATPDLPQT